MWLECSHDKRGTLTMSTGQASIFFSRVPPGGQCGIFQDPEADKNKNGIVASSEIASIPADTKLYKNAIGTSTTFY